MTFTARLFNHLLTNVYGENRTRMAHKLGLDLADFRKTYHRLMDGETSPTTLENMMELCAREGISVDAVLKEHRALLEIHPATDLPCPYIDYMDRMGNRIETIRSKIHLLIDLLKLYKHAEKLMLQMRVVCCGENTSSSLACEKYWRWRETGYADCDTEDCPCKRFAEFIEWLDRNMERSSPKD